MGNGGLVMRREGQNKVDIQSYCVIRGTAHQHANTAQIDKMTLCPPYLILSGISDFYLASPSVCSPHGQDVQVQILRMTTQNSKSTQPGQEGLSLQVKTQGQYPLGLSLSIIFEQKFEQAGNLIFGPLIYVIPMITDSLQNFGLRGIQT